MRIQIPASLTKRKLLKGNVDVISNDSLWSGISDSQRYPLNLFVIVQSY